LQYHRPQIVNEIPIVRSVGVSGGIDKALSFIQQQRQFALERPQFIFLHLHCWMLNTSEWTELATELSGIDGVEVVRPDVLMQLLGQWDGRGNALVRYSVWGLILGAAGALAWVVARAIRRAWMVKRSQRSN
jgi:hypothetical protein